MTPEDLLDDVKDRDSFIAFVESLAAERANAAKLEHEKPQTYIVDGAYNWKNADIASFLYAALTYFDERPLLQPEKEPSWRMFANFLYCGKIIE
jgi:hypothetical protein